MTEDEETGLEALGLNKTEEPLTARELHTRAKRLDEGDEVILKDGRRRYKNPYEVVESVAVEWVSQGENWFSSRLKLLTTYSRNRPKGVHKVVVGEGDGNAVVYSENDPDGTVYVLKLNPVLSEG